MERMTDHSYMWVSKSGAVIWTLSEQRDLGANATVKRRHGQDTLP